MIRSHRARSVSAVEMAGRGSRWTQCMFDNRSSVTGPGHPGPPPLNIVTHSVPPPMSTHVSSPPVAPLHLLTNNLHCLLHNFCFNFSKISIVHCKQQTHTSYLLNNFQIQAVLGGEEVLIPTTRSNTFNILMFSSVSHILHQPLFC